ncbi:hypothetical protein [Geodermatophilus nigrescens]|uniref:Uncharacterized protein n=1 Tax=Geodermatophilus nigrescens TaxID=1070870 RepID=A0A1M5IYG9_9ACTN|nr:hypothetical protein [Geodermatophilus nigrescens]SHG33089.1 hypothetical protein SAMN05444351_2262 [Geodermatophilus nigrescens]
MPLALACAPLTGGVPAPPPELGPAARPLGEGWAAPTAGPAAAVEAVAALVRRGGWRIGVGAAPGDDDGPVALAARRALEAASRRPARLAVRGTDAGAAADAQAVLAALAVLLARRSDAAWAAVDLVAAGGTRAAAASALGISRQAVAQRLAAGGWDLEQELRPAAARLLARAAG